MKLFWTVQMNQYKVKIDLTILVKKIIMTYKIRKKLVNI